MANDINLCTFTGRLGRDAELKYLPNGDPVANFSIAVGESYKSKAGEKAETTEWVNCKAFRQLAEICGQYLTKGKQVAIVGKMKTRKWKDKEGNDRYTTEIVVDQMTMLGGKGEGEQRQEEAPKPAARPQKPTPDDPFADMDNSIPF